MSGRAAMLVRAGAVLVALAAAGCGYVYFAGPLQPVAAQPSAYVEVGHGDGGGVEVVYRSGGLEIGLRALNDEELNRQFPEASTGGVESTNPYTFGDTRFWKGKPERSRFTVFRLRVHNTGYPKIKIDPQRVSLECNHERSYWSLSHAQLATYYNAYVTAYEGNQYDRYQERIDLLRRTLFQNEEIFVEQEREGYIVFPPLHPDVWQVTLVLHDVVLRFDARNEPAETVAIRARFERDIGKLHGDGRLEPFLSGD